MTAIALPDEDECYLIAIMDDPSGIELAEFCWIDEEQEDGCFRCWDFQWAMFRREETFQIDYCIGEGQLVLTDRGYIPIEDVRVGDRVLTHLGRWRAVTAVHDRGVRPVSMVKGFGHPGLLMTEDHELFARRIRRGSICRDGHKGKILQDPEWRAPRDWVWNDGSGEMTANWATPATVHPLPRPPQMQPAYHAGRQNYVRDYLTKEWMWLFGAWLADGSTYADAKTPLRRVVWNVNIAKSPAIRAALDAVGLNYSVHRTGKVDAIAVLSRPVHDWLIENGGRLAHGKSLPAWLFGLDMGLRQALLDGILHGDGHLRPDGSIDYTTVSRAMSFGVRTLAATLGYSVSMWTRDAGMMQIDGRTSPTRTAYKLSIRDLTARSLATAVQDGRHIWSALKSVTRAGDGHVWDLSVEEDHSYVVEGVVVHNCGRSLGKSTGIIMRAFAFCFNYPGQEMLITAPELNHLRPVTDKIEYAILSHRLTREMLPRQRGNGINHQPQFQCHFANNARIVSRLPQRSGQGVKGQHPLVIESDEMQDFPENGWIELIETMKHYVEGAQWRCHGVSRGVRDRYYRYTMGQDPDLPFYVHRYMAMHRPSWSAEERKNKEAIYGSRDNVDYRRNIYGEHGDATNPIFVLARLMQCVRLDESPWATTYNQDVFQRIKVTDDMVTGSTIHPYLQINGAHLDKAYSSFWAGADIGFTRDPTEILVFGECEQPKGDSLLRLLLRLHLMRVSAADQADAVRVLFDFYGERLRCFAIDKTGVGLPLWQELDPEAVGTAMHLRRTPEHIARRVVGYGFSQKVAVELDDRPLEGGERPEDAVIEKNIVDFATDELRKLVDSRPPRIELPNDRELLTEFQGQEVQYVRDEGSASGVKRSYVGGSFHTLDAAKMMIAGRNLQLMRAVLASPRRSAPTLDRFA